MPEVIRNRFPGPSTTRDADYQDAPRTRPGFGPDEDPLAELARIVGEGAPPMPAQAPSTSRRPPMENRDTIPTPRDYPRRDTSWRDPQARTTVRAGLTPQTMPGQLDDLEAELFSEISSENLRNLPPAPDLAELGLPDARAPQYRATPPAATVSPRRTAPTGPAASGSSAHGNPGNQDLDDEITLPMHSVLRATPPSARASEGNGMQQPPRFNPVPVQRSGQDAAPADGHDAYGHETYFDDHVYDNQGDHDPAGALGATYHDYEENEAAYYAGAEHNHAEPQGHASAANAGYQPVLPQYDGQHGQDARFEDDDDAFAKYRGPQAIRRPPARRTSPLLLGVAAVGAVLVLGVGSVFAYRAISHTGATGDNAPLIRADTRPVKELVAQQPLGAAGPNLDASRSDGQDKLVTQTEDPVDQIPGKPPVRVVGLGAQTPSLAPVQRVHSVIVRPDGTIVTPDDASAKPSPVGAPVRTASLPTTDVPVVSTPTDQAAPGQAAPSPALPPLGAVTHIDPVPVTPKPNPAPPALIVPKPAVAQVQPPVTKPAKPVPALVPHAPAPDTNGPLSLDPSSTPASPTRVAIASPPVAAPVPKAAAPTDAGTGEYMVQISSQRSDAEARHALQVAEQKYAAIGAKGGDVQQADLGARGVYYRARLAGGTRDQAVALCSQIKAQGSECVVAKR
jgi:hypothetical protein